MLSDLYTVGTDMEGKVEGRMIAGFRASITIRAGIKRVHKDLAWCTRNRERYSTQAVGYLGYTELYVHSVVTFVEHQSATRPENSTNTNT